MFGEGRGLSCEVAGNFKAAVEEGAELDVVGATSSERRLAKGPTIFTGSR